MSNDYIYVVNTVSDNALKEELEGISHGVDTLLKSGQNPYGVALSHQLSNEFLQLSEREHRDAVANWIIHEFFNEMSMAYDDSSKCKKKHKFILV